MVARQILLYSVVTVLASLALASCPHRLALSNGRTCGDSTGVAGGLLLLERAAA